MQLVTLPTATRAHKPVKATAQVFEDPSSRALLEHLQRIAPSEASVLIIGETGTGKEVIARHIHALSTRRHGNFVAVNCGALSESMIEAELFGHEKGAYTGAVGAKAGWFEEANGGTLFLDEIGDLPLGLQVKLLRVLQEREVVRLGSRDSVSIDVRVLAATNVRLEEAIAAGRFREDLFYRLNVVDVILRPLRERPDDILPLARHFLSIYGQHIDFPHIADEARDKLRRHEWPGNIRELENAVHHAVLLCQDNVLRAEDFRLSARLRENKAAAPGVTETRRPDEPTDLLLNRAFARLFDEAAGTIHERVENALLRAAYSFCECNQVQTASLLGLSRNVTRSLLIKSGELVVVKRQSAETEDWRRGPSLTDEFIDEDE